MRGEERVKHSSFVGQLVKSLQRKQELKINNKF